MLATTTILYRDLVLGSMVWVGLRCAGSVSHADAARWVQSHEKRHSLLVFAANWGYGWY